MCLCTVKRTVVTVFAALDFTLPWLTVMLSTSLNIYCVCLATTNTIQFKLCIFNCAFVHCMCFCTVKHTVMTIFAALDFILSQLPVMLLTSLNIHCVCLATTDIIQFASCIYHHAFARSMYFCTIKHTVNNVRSN